MGNARKARRVAQPLPEHVRGSDYRETSLLATSPATMKQHESRRGQPLIVPATVKMWGMARLSVRELMDLRIDMRYQREEVTLEVNELIIVLKKGGTIPDPISVAERKYGDGARYIVDGQQRWWAHVDCGVPIQAVIFHVFSYEDEVLLFHALNTQKRVNPEVRLRSMPGPAGDTLRRLNEHPASPLHGHVSFSVSGNAGVPSMILMRGLASLISNTVGTGSVDRIVQTFDRYYKMSPSNADRFVDAYATLISQVFDNQNKLQFLASIALGRFCYAAFTSNPRDLALPSGRQITRLKALDWKGLTPSCGVKWLPTLQAAIQNIWPVQLVQETKP